MKYLFDTCTVSDFVKGQSGVLTRTKATPPTQITISVVTLMEIEYGLILNPNRRRRLAPVMDRFLGSISVLPLNEADALTAAAIRVALQRQGQPIGPYDLLIAGCSLARGLILVTSNTSEFERVGGLVVENWR